MYSWKFFGLSLGCFLVGLIIWRTGHSVWLVVIISLIGLILGVLAGEWPWPSWYTPSRQWQVYGNSDYNPVAGFLGIVAMILNLGVCIVVIREFFQTLK